MFASFKLYVPQSKKRHIKIKPYPRNDLQLVLTHLVWDNFLNVFYTVLFVDRALFTDPKTGRWFEFGDTYKNLKLAKTLKILAKEGGDAMYTGKLASSLVKDIQGAGGIVTEEDLKDYRSVYSRKILYLLLISS